MSAEPTPIRPVPVEAAEPKPRPDLADLQELVYTVAGFSFYFIGAVGGALAVGVAFYAWAGFLVLLVAGGLPSGYVLRKSAERVAERERRAEYRATQERTATAKSVDIPTLG